MSNLLVPIDFTAYSKAAIRYACAIATANGQSIDFIHAFGENDDIYAEALKDPEFRDPRVTKAQLDAERILEKTRQNHPNISATVLFYDGSLPKAVEKQSQKKQYDAIVISKEGESGLISLFRGNQTYDIISNTKLPVLAVPTDASEFKNGRIALLCNFKPGEIAVLKQALPIVGKDFELVLIHVNKDDKSDAELSESFSSFSERIKNETGIEHITFVTKPKSYYSLQSDNLSTTIHQVLLDENVDLVFVTKSKKSIFRNLTEENIVKKMTILLKIPKFFAKVD